MRKALIIIWVMLLALFVAGCNKTPPDVPDNIDKDIEQNQDDEQLLHLDDYDEFLTDIYLCDDVYRTDDTPTHGSGSISLPMSQDILELKDYQILLCGDGCPPESVVSRASQGYAPAYRVVPDGEIDGNFKTLKFKMKLDEAWLNDTINSGINVAIEETLGSKYFYLLVLDEKHYAYIHLKVIDGVDSEVEHEAELADSIVKNARVSFEPKNEKLDLTLEQVIRLAENKGKELTWSDFQMYNAIETGSGLYILVYEIDETFDLIIGGSSPESSPMYIRLVTKADWDNYIDIRTEDVEKFISENRESVAQKEELIYSLTNEITALPSDEESAILTAATVGGSTHFYYFEQGLEFYRYDPSAEKHYKCVLELPPEYTNGEIIALITGAGSGEIEIVVKASFEGKTVYPGCIYYNDNENIPDRQLLTTGMNDRQQLIERGIIAPDGTELICGYPTVDKFYK